MKSIVWLRNDLRLLDNPALWHACNASEEVVALYLITEDQWKSHGDAICKINFWLKNLSSLQNSLAELNIPLKILEAEVYKNCPEVISKYCKEKNISNVYLNLEYPINELNRDREVTRLLKKME